jgi:hypothetical protein
MHHLWQSEQYVTNRRRDLTGEAQQARLAAAYRAGRPPLIVRIYGPAMYRIGTWLVAWGAGLQARYGARAADNHPEALAFAADNGDC